MPDDWEWGFVPFSSTNPPTDEAKDRFPRIESDKRGPCRKRPLDKVDPDPYVPWTDLKMGRTHTSCPDASSTGPQPQVHERVVPLQAEVGQEFLDKLASEGRKNKAPAPDAGSSQAPPAKRPRTEILGGKEVGKRRYKKKTMPVSSGPALSLSKGATGTMPGSSEGTARTSSPPRSSPVHLGTGSPSASPLGGTPSAGRAVPTTSDHRAEEDLVPPPNTQDTGASNIGADTEAAGRAEPQVPPVRKEKKKKKSSCSSPSKAVPDSSAPASSTPPPEAPVLEPTGATPPPPPEAPVPEPAGATPTPPPEASTAKPTRDAQMPPPAQGPSASKPTPPPEGAKLRVSEPFKGKGTASGPQSLVLHAGPAAVVAGERATGLLGRITELKREGKELEHLLDYAEKWN
nr:pollen-specific leucine-rich repeat extensin-like protein 1 [Lolium perenne]